MTSAALLVASLALFAPARAGADEPACAALRANYKDDPRPLLLFNLAECEEKAGRIATAVVHYDEYLKSLEPLSDAEQREERERERLAASRKEALERELPRVTLTLPVTAPAGTRVTRALKGGDDPVPVALNVPLPIDPGEHSVTVDAPGRPRWARRFFVQKGDKKTIELEVPPAEKGTERPTRIGKPIEPVPAYLPPLDPGISGRRVATYVIGGIGVAGIVVGAVTGAVVLADKAPIADNCNNDHICNPTGEAAKDQARISGIASTASFIVGFAGLATGAVLYWTEPSAAKLSMVPHQVRIGSAGLTGAAMEMQWAW